MHQNLARSALTLALTLIPAASAAQGGTPVRAPMLGSWLYGTLSSIDYYDRTTNRWMDASGASEIVTFFADGRYERTRLLSLTTYSCTSKLFIYEKGTVKIEGDKITYRPSEGVNKGYTCTPSNSWETKKINPETWTFGFERNDAGQDVMVMRGKESELHYGRYRR
ncbi:hypothetical protein DAETH_39500 (plasmid) [Deinococcus aetherius]|uniref:DUF306 domain-containing protein n=1 Tax=Deinococcus aetherius TaxID=200252 RepID=A0ABN6RL23_9DEIO|nr:hypothetical protein [Deinococcus aetherius]BDP43981.1 hypothetical protein DAETH_39500 [Deinococcus aetherius]